VFYVSMWLKKITLRHAEHEGTQRKPFVKLRGLSALVVKKINTETRRTPRNTAFIFLILHFTLEILHWKFLIEFLCSPCLRGKFEFCFLIFCNFLLRSPCLRGKFEFWDLISCNFLLRSPCLRGKFEFCFLFFVIFFCVLPASEVKKITRKRRAY